MFRCIKKVFVVVIGFIGLNIKALTCVSMSNQECKVKPAIINISSNESLFYLYIIFRSKCSGSSNGFNNPSAKLCVPDVIKDINIKLFNLMSSINETSYIIV